MKRPSRGTALVEMTTRPAIYLQYTSAFSYIIGVVEMKIGRDEVTPPRSHVTLLATQCYLRYYEYVLLPSAAKGLTYLLLSAIFDLRDPQTLTLVPRNY